MSSYLTYLRRSKVKLPIWCGISIAHIPFGKRPGIGKDYADRQKEILLYSKLDINGKKDFIYKKFFDVFQHSINNIPFYNRLYNSHGIATKDLKCFDDIKNVPIIKKADLINISIEERSAEVKGRFMVNTGGSTGEPLYLYMDPKRFSNEWAHIHYFWNKIGYTPTCLKLVFDGRSDVSEGIQYDFVRNSIRYDIYSDHSRSISKLKTIMQKYDITHLHGYPSAIYDFACYCEKNEVEFVKQLSKSLKGVFLTSEFPNPVYRKKIEDLFHVKTQSFYGHTETCVMAYETQKFEFEVLQTYGYAECSKVGEEQHLVGTSYYNFASPLIRYDTEDVILPKSSDDLSILKSFSITKGRSGEYILDANHKKIPLTGLIFGRHHSIFEIAKYVQLEQKSAGSAIIYFVPHDTADLYDLEGMFDSSNVLITFEFIMLQEPILTKSGKVSLLVKTL